MLSPTDSISISVWDAKKVSSEESSSGFLGAVRVSQKSLLKLKDAGRKLIR